MDTWLFCLLAIMNNAPVNIGVQITCLNPFNSFGCVIPRSRIAGSYVNFLFNFLRNYFPECDCTVLPSKVLKLIVFHVVSVQSIL